MVVAICGSLLPFFVENFMIGVVWNVAVFIKPVIIPNETPQLTDTSGKFMVAGS